MKNRKDDDNESCCGADFLKYVLFIFNFFFLLAGLAVLGVGIWTLIDKRLPLAVLTTHTFAATAYLLIAAGGAVVIITIIGCVAVSKEDRRTLIMYTFLLLLIFLAEAVAGGLAYIYEEQVYSDLAVNLNTTFLENYGMNSARTEAIDIMHREYRCCGAMRFEDWRASLWLKKNPQLNNTVPDSCCRTESPGCGARDHPSNIYYDGCIHRLELEIKNHLLILGAVGLGVCFVQVFGMIFSCCLWVKLRNEKEDPY